MEKIEIPKPKDPNNLADVFISFVEIVKLLRQHCPWDREQTNESISHLIIEEAYETLDAVQKKNDVEFAKELGDLLLHIVMHAIMAEERKAFNLIDVINKISEKMVLRHPHVFGDIKVSGEGEVLENWEKIKKQEGRKNTLDGVPISLPALLRAERIQQKASRVGFDWDNKQDVWKKVDEEYAELKAELQNGNAQKVQEEFGDLLFALVNAARFENIVPESALQLTNTKFINRFRYVEEQARKTGKDLSNMTLAEMDALWNEAKEKGIK